MVGIADVETKNARKRCFDLDSLRNVGYHHFKDAWHFGVVAVLEGKNQEAILKETINAWRDRKGQADRVDCDFRKDVCAVRLINQRRRRNAFNQRTNNADLSQQGQLRYLIDKRMVVKLEEVIDQLSHRIGLVADRMVGRFKVSLDGFVDVRRRVFDDWRFGPLWRQRRSGTPVAIRFGCNGTSRHFLRVEC